MSYNQVMKAVKAGNLQSVYVLYGTEYYFIDQLKKSISQTANSDEMVYDLREVPLQEAVTDAETFPFFDDKKLIFIYHPVFLQAKPEKTAVQHDVQVLEQYVNGPVDHSILVIIAPYEKLDARKKITKQLKKAAVMVDCNPVKHQNFRQILHDMAGRHHIQIEQSAVDLLESEFQDNLYMLEKEIEKLANFAGEKSTISKEVAAEVISPSNTSNALQFVDAVLKKDLSQAIKIFKELEKMSEEPIGLIALLAYQFRVIYQVKLMQEKGYTLDRMKSEIKVHPYVVQLARDRSKYFSKDRLSAFIHYLTEADESIKRGQMDKGIAFEMLLYRLTASQSTK